MSFLEARTLRILNSRRKETKMNSTLETGKDYKCGDKIVRIMHIEKGKRDGGLAYLYPQAYGKAVDHAGDALFIGATGTFGVDNGCYCVNNPESLRHDLKETKEAKEMTVAEISEALGYDVKVVKGD